MSLKIHAFPISPRSFKVLAVANHLGLDYAFSLCNLAKGDQRTPEYQSININMKAPALEHDDFRLWESNAIIQYLATLKPEAGLLPKDERARADVTRWQFWESTTWDPACAIIVFERFVKGAFGGGGPDPAEVEKGLKKFNAAASILDAHLKNHTWVCGDQLTIADFALGSVLIMEQAVQLPTEVYAEIRRWGAQLKALPAWGATLAQQNVPAAA